jgi:hypothetical protein
MRQRIHVTSDDLEAHCLLYVTVTPVNIIDRRYEEVCLSVPVAPVEFVDGGHVDIHPSDGVLVFLDTARHVYAHAEACLSRITAFLFGPWSPAVSPGISTTPGDRATFSPLVPWVVPGLPCTRRLTTAV